jgi:hypothetical protein
MKVKELIAILEEQDADAEVLMMSQRRWPFEYATYGVAVRSEFEECDDEEDAEGMAPRGADGRCGSDVFLVEGTQLRYGSKAAWDTALRE